MLSRFVLKITALLYGIILASTLMVTEERGAPLNLPELLGDPCERPCWQGIIPGETTTFEVLDILQSHPWIINVTTTRSLRENPPQADSEGTITWDWSGRQPAVLFAGGTISIRRNIVQTIHLITLIPFGETWLALGWPDRGSVQFSRAYSDRIDVNLAIYADEGLALRSIVPRPNQPWTFWHARVEILLQAHQPNETRYQLPCWFCS